MVFKRRFHNARALGRQLQIYETHRNVKILEKAIQPTSHSRQMSIAVNQPITSSSYCSIMFSHGMSGVPVRY